MVSIVVDGRLEEWTPTDCQCVSCSNGAVWSGYAEGLVFMCDACGYTFQNPSSVDEAKANAQRCAALRAAEDEEDE